MIAKCRPRGRATFAPLTLLLAGALLVSGCGRRETAAARAAREGILLRSAGAQNLALDPHLATTLAESTVLKSVLEGLVEPDPRTLEPQPAVAESWDLSPDRLTYTFHLRPTARWSNGDPVTAQDFADSFRRALSPELGAPNAYLMYVLRGARDFAEGRLDDPTRLGIEAPDEHTLRLTLEAPCPYFLSLLTHSIWLPVHLPSIRAAGPVSSRTNDWTRARPYVGNGPFSVSEYAPGQVLRVRRNPQYWDAATVQLHGIDFLAYEVAAEERAFAAGQLHVTEALPKAKLPAYRRDRPDALHISPAFGTYFYRLNVTRPPLDDVRVRRALSAAIDRQAITEHVLAGEYVPARAFTPPGPGGYQPPPLTVSDAAAARRLLAEAGHANGEGIRYLELLFNDSEDHQLIAEAIQQMWQGNLGIEVRLAKREYSVFYDDRRQLNFDICRASWFGDFLDPISFLEIFTTGNANNQTGWSNPDYDRLIEEARTLRDPAERLQRLRTAEEILLRESPIIPIFVYSTVRLVDPRVGGWFDNLLDQHPAKYLFLKTPSSP